jgi:hypothetical protein
MTNLTVHDGEQFILYAPLLELFLTRHHDNYLTLAHDVTIWQFQDQDLYDARHHDFLQSDLSISTKSTDLKLYLQVQNREKKYVSLIRSDNFYLTYSNTRLQWSTSGPRLLLKLHRQPTHFLPSEADVLDLMVELEKNRRRGCTIL